MEHDAVAVEPEKVAHGVGAFGRHEVIEVAGACGGVDPLLQSAGGGVAVVVDAERPAGNDGDAGEPVASDVGGVWPHVVLLVAEHWTRVVADAVSEAVVPPGSQGVAVVETCDGGRDQCIGAEIAIDDASLVKPFLVPVYFLVDVVVGSVVLSLMGEGVRQVEEGIAVGGSLHPDGERVAVEAVLGIRVGGWGCWPTSFAGSQGFLEFERCGFVFGVDWSTLAHT